MAGFTIATLQGSPPKQCFSALHMSSILLEDASLSILLSISYFHRLVGYLYVLRMLILFQLHVLENFPTVL